MQKAKNRTPCSSIENRTSFKGWIFERLNKGWGVVKIWEAVQFNKYCFNNFILKEIPLGEEEIRKLFEAGFNGEIDTAVLAVGKSYAQIRRLAARFAAPPVEEGTSKPEITVKKERGGRKLKINLYKYMAENAKTQTAAEMSMTTGIHINTIYKYMKKLIEYNKTALHPIPVIQKHRGKKFNEELSEYVRVNMELLTALEIAKNKGVTRQTIYRYVRYWERVYLAEN